MGRERLFVHLMLLGFKWCLEGKPRYSSGRDCNPLIAKSWYPVTEAACEKGRLERLLTGKHIFGCDGSWIAVVWPLHIMSEEGALEGLA